MVRGSAVVAWPLARSRLVRKCHFVCTDNVEALRAMPPSTRWEIEQIGRGPGAPRAGCFQGAGAPCGGAAAVRSRRRRSGGAPSLYFF